MRTTNLSPLKVVFALGLLLVLGTFLGSTYHRNPAQAGPPTPTAVPAGNTATTPPVSDQTVPVPNPAPAQSATPAPVTRATCPADMALVDGNYCRTVTHLCLEGARELRDKRDPHHVIGWEHVDCPDGCQLNYCTVYKPDVVKCTGGEKPMRFCMDKYEYPNRKGELPRVQVTWYQAEAACKAEGKRLCGDDEWTLACEGPQRLPYPYGWKRDKTKCNISRTVPNVDRSLLHPIGSAAAERELARIDERKASGSMSECVSPYGVYDTTGNPDEWTVNRTENGQPYQSMLKGGHMMIGARNRCRPATDIHGPLYDDFSAGFRCCANPN